MISAARIRKSWWRWRVHDHDCEPSSGQRQESVRPGLWNGEGYRTACVLYGYLYVCLCLVVRIYVHNICFFECLSVKYISIFFCVHWTWAEGSSCLLWNSSGVLTRACKYRDPYKERLVIFYFAVLHYSRTWAYQSHRGRLEVRQGLWHFRQARQTNCGLQHKVHITARWMYAELCGSWKYMYCKEELQRGRTIQC